jgi:Ribbon-helix-helix protein, copG family
VKRLQIMIDEDLDQILDRMALDQGTSKAFLIRRFVRERVAPLPPMREDPLWELVGADAYDPGAGSADDVVSP